MEQNSLFGDEFEIKIEQPKVKDLLKSINKKQKETEEPDATKVLKSKKVSLTEKLSLIKINVLQILGKQKNNVLVIKDRETLHNYITEAIKTGRIAVDTETNNSLDPATCKLMGPCLYYPGGKQAYVPLNHRDPETKERLSYQLTEQDCKEEFQRIVDSKIDIIMHNGKFDYEVIKCTCGIELVPTWDTMVCARLLNENERAGLKEQYTSKIDKSQEKYHIDELFENVAYADVDPSIFALYAATDSMMTDKLYEIQKVELDKPEYGPHLDLSGKHEVKGLRWLFHEVEMPIVVITAEMELTGVDVDTEFGERLKIKYNKQLEECDSKINAELSAVEEIIKKWKVTPEATERTKAYVAKKTKMTADKIEKMYPEIDKDGNRFKYGKAKSEQLDDPIKLASPIQLAILFYDILKAPAPADSRATGEEELTTLEDKVTKILTKQKELNKLAEAQNISVEDVIIKLTAAKNLCSLILERRGIMKLLTTYIEVIPDLVKHWPDHRIRFHLNPLGTDTGRFSSGGRLGFMENEERIEVSGINIQNIPSHNPEIRMLFRGAINKHQVELTNNYYEVPETDEVETINGWKQVEELKIGDIIVGENNQETIINIIKNDKIYLLYI